MQAWKWSAGLKKDQSLRAKLCSHFHPLLLTCNRPAFAGPANKERKKDGKLTSTNAISLLWSAVLWVERDGEGEVFLMHIDQRYSSPGTSWKLQEVPGLERC